jgi:hypothetical protein
MDGALLSAPENFPLAEVVYDCPRCGSSRVTFDVHALIPIGTPQYGWQQSYEAFGVCRNCRRGTVLYLRQERAVERKLSPRELVAAGGSLAPLLKVVGYVSLKDMASVEPPEFLPPDIQSAFEEGARCLTVSAPNAAAAMFRLCLDLATKDLLPDEDVDGLNRRGRRDLGLRLPWLFRTGRLPRELEELSHCIREDGNDGAHDGTLTMNDAQDVCDFARMLLERQYTEPERLRQAQQRRDERRKDNSR